MIDIRKKGDVLGFVVDYILLFERKFFKIYIILTLTGSLVEFCCMTFYIYTDPEKYMKIYGFRYFTFLHPANVIFFSIVKKRDLLRLYDWVWKTALPLDLSAPQLLSDIVKEVRIVKMFFVISNVVGAIVIGTWMIPSDTDSIFVIEDIIRPYCGQYMTYMQVLNRMSFPCMLYILQCPVLAYIYLGRSTTMQYCILKDAVRNLKNTFHEGRLYTHEENLLYQQEVRRTLKIASSVHYMISSTVRRGSRWFGKEIASFGVVGLTVGTAILYYISEANYNLPLVEFCRFGGFGMVGGIQIIFLILTGQNFIDTGEAIHNDLCSLPWDSFDISNKKMLLFLQTHTVKPIAYSLCSDLVIDVTMLIKFPKMIFSITTLLAAQTSK